ncbi:MAG TPA: AprI/Inh family metalloprotease inhibitor [Rhodoblastus sp.]|nr:AprI/Inh family metalloprotease inhibitor [Rhodoblastus sp.]
MTRLTDFLTRRAAPGAWLAIGILAASPALAADARSEQSAAGVWRLSQGAGRECTIQLRAEARGEAHALGMPPGCRHAMPGLAKVAGWKLPAPDRIELLDKGGASVLAFAPDNGELSAKGPKGEFYALTAASEPRRPAQRETQPANVARGPSVPASEMPGRYSVLRDGNKDTGCMLTLQPGGRAQLAPACRDNGIVVFDPVGWSYAGGKLMLRARKGHHANFEYESDQSWQKDPKEGGKKLGFRKM